jgi:hypothetical protein
MVSNTVLKTTIVLADSSSLPFTVIRSSRLTPKGVCKGALKNSGVAPSRLSVLTLPTSKRARVVVGLKN